MSVKPTIHELEAILDSDEPQRVTMAPDGQVTVEPQVTLEEAAYGVLWRLGPIGPTIVAARLVLLERIGGKHSAGHHRAIAWASAKLPPSDLFDCWEIDDAALSGGTGVEPSAPIAETQISPEGRANG